MATPTPARPDLALSAPQLDRIILGDCLEVLRSLPDACVDAIVTDPPAGISFMGKGWDSDKGGRDAWIAWLSEVMAECLRVLKPGGHALVWALPRTSHWTAMALEDAGWEVRDRLAHVFGSGFPKSLDVSKALDKAAGAQRNVTRIPTRKGNAERRGNGDQGATYGDVWGGFTTESKPATDAARQWDGWGTALKPAVEDWWLCRKPLAEPTIAANVLAWGTGALNIGASRVGVADDEPNRRNNPGVGTRPRTVYGDGLSLSRGPTLQAGRWPANLLLSHAEDCLPDTCSLWCPVRELDAQSGVRESRPGKTKPTARSSWFTGQYSDGVSYPGDTGGASRFFSTFRYQAKAGRAERNRGCETMAARAVYGTSGAALDGISHSTPAQNHHPTVKPLALMSWLITLITPPGGVILDPFAGSGSTLVAAKMGGWRYLGIEREAEYVAIAEARLAATAEPSLGSAVLMERPKAATATPRKRKANQPTQPLWEGQEMRA